MVKAAPDGSRASGSMWGASDAGSGRVRGAAA
jgi:hypothetical protein